MSSLDRIVKALEEARAGGNRAEVVRLAREILAAPEHTMEQYVLANDALSEVDSGSPTTFRIGQPAPDDKRDTNIDAKNTIQNLDSSVPPFVSPRSTSSVTRVVPSAESDKKETDLTKQQTDAIAKKIAEELMTTNPSFDPTRVLGPPMSSQRSTDHVPASTSPLIGAFIRTLFRPRILLLTAIIAGLVVYLGMSGVEEKHRCEFVLLRSGLDQGTRSLEEGARLIDRLPKETLRQLPTQPEVIHAFQERLKEELDVSSNISRQELRASISATVDIGQAGVSDLVMTVQFVAASPEVAEDGAKILKQLVLERHNEFVSKRLREQIAYFEKLSSELEQHVIKLESELAAQPNSSSFYAIMQPYYSNLVSLQRERSEVERKIRQSGLGANHPTTKRLKDIDTEIKRLEDVIIRERQAFGVGIGEHAGARYEYEGGGEGLHDNVAKRLEELSNAESSIALKQGQLAVRKSEWQTNTKVLGRLRAFYSDEYTGLRVLSQSFEPVSVNPGLPTLVLLAIIVGFAVSALIVLIGGANRAHKRGIASMMQFFHSF